MPKSKRPGTKARKKRFVIGRDGFGKIGAIEGIQLTPSARKRAVDAEREELSSEEHRQTIVRSFRKA
jgi:hypothetical protein